MLHVILSLFVIPVAVWILSSLFRGSEEEGPANRQRPNPRNRGAPAHRPRRPVTDIDAFLQEINRRRREGAQRDQPPTVLPPPIRAPRPAPRPQTPRRQSMPTPVAPATPRSVPAPPTGEIPQVVEVVVAESPKPVLLRQPVLPARSAAPAPVAEAFPGPPRVPTSAPATVVAKNISPALTQLLPFLRSAQSMRTAILLQEILGRPRCRRLLPKKA